jgi:hypothetical protein
VRLCLLLAALFLYNPFLTAPAADAGLHLRHSHSNRATVGASELQQFTPAKERQAFEAQAEERNDGVSFAVPPPEERLATACSEVPAPQAFWAANLWFRPPPLA